MAFVKSMTPNRNGENRHPSLIPDLGKETIQSFTMFQRVFEYLSAISVPDANSEAVPVLPGDLP